MAFEEYDDFEQEQLVKDWIKNNWLTIASGIVLGLGGVIGINYWKAQQQEQRYQKAVQYTSFTEVMKLSEFDEAQSILTEMESKSGSSFYTYQAHLLLAKEFVAKNELEKAATELQSVIASKPDQLLTEFVKLRLARVYNAMQKHDDALTQTSQITLESFLSIAKEIEGDAYFAKGEMDKAKSAFEDSAEKGNGYSGKRNIEMKLENS
ncbi:MAG: tetratricopeptide repeat protein [Alcanivoracaceae bacterium]|nr:tetratricopeptide repeat protein [Alcanivoracaceae bacterium]